VAAGASTLVAGASNFSYSTTVTSSRAAFGEAVLTHELVDVSRAAFGEAVLAIELVDDTTGGFSGQSTPVKGSADCSPLTLSGSCKVDMRGVDGPSVSSAGNFPTGVE